MGVGRGEKARKETIMFESFVKKLKDCLLERSGYVWWTPSQPGVKGPQPRLITREQVDAMKKDAADRGDCILKHDNDYRDGDERACLVIAVTVLMTSLSVFAGIRCSRDGDVAVVQSVEPDTEDGLCRIPEIYEGRKVTCIAAGAVGPKVRAIVIPATVTNISENVFTELAYCPCAYFEGDVCHGWENIHSESVYVKSSFPQWVVEHETNPELICYDPNQRAFEVSIKDLCNDSWIQSDLEEGVFECESDYDFACIQFTNSIDLIGTLSFKIKKFSSVDACVFRGGSAEIQQLAMGEWTDGRYVAKWEDVSIPLSGENFLSIRTTGYVLGKLQLKDMKFTPYYECSGVTGDLVDTTRYYTLINGQIPNGVSDTWTENIECTSVDYSIYLSPFSPVFSVQLYCSMYYGGYDNWYEFSGQFGGGLYEGYVYVDRDVDYSLLHQVEISFEASGTAKNTCRKSMYWMWCPPRYDFFNIELNAGAHGFFTGALQLYNSDMWFQWGKNITMMSDVVNCWRSVYASCYYGDTTVTCSGFGDPVPPHLRSWETIDGNGIIQVDPGWAFCGWCLKTQDDYALQEMPDYVCNYYSWHDWRMCYEAIYAPVKNPIEYVTDEGWPWKYKSEQEEMAMPKDYEYDNLSEIELPDVESLVDGYSCKGWDLVEIVPMEIEEQIYPEENIGWDWNFFLDEYCPRYRVYKAVFKPVFIVMTNQVRFVVGLNGNVDENVELSQFVPWKEFAEVPEIMPTPGWRFLGWDGDVTQPITNDVTFTAQYEAIEYKLSFEGLKGGAVDYPTTFTVTNSISLVPLADTKDFRFDYWLVNGEIADVIPVGTAVDTVVVAHWTPFVKLGEGGITGWSGMYDGTEHTVSVFVAEPESYSVSCSRLVSGLPTGSWTSMKDVGTVSVRVTVSAEGYAPISRDVTVDIAARPLSTCTLETSGVANYINGPVTWSKRAYDPVAKMTLSDSCDYSVSFVQTGDFTGRATFTGRGNYTGTENVQTVISITTPFETVGNTTWYYQQFADKATLVRRGDAIASSLTGAVVIPDTVNGLPVTEIADGAFANCSEVTAFVIPEGVAILGDGVFAGCSALKSVVFLGDAPEAPRTFGGAPAELIVYAMPGSRGWGAPVHDVLPERWPFGDDESLTRVIAWLPEVEITPTTGIRSGRVAVTMNYAGVPGIEREIRYTSDGTDPVAASTLYDKRFSLNVDEKTMVKAAAFCGGYRFGSVSSSTFLTSLEEVIVNEGSGAVALENDAAAPWTYDDTELGCGGRACLRSGAIGDNGTSSLTATFEGEGLLTFSWKTSCEYDDFGEFFFDHAECLLDGVVVAQADGKTDWADVEIPVSGKGAHSLVWRYVKDDADEDGADYGDCVWLGNVAFSFPAYVRFASEYGTGTGIEAIVSSSGHTVELPDYEGDFDYPFHRIVGWRDGTVEYRLGDTYVVTRPEATLFAIWEEKRLPTPVIDVAAEYDGEYTLVGMSCGDGSHEIYYTLDGSHPTLESQCYPGDPIAVTGNVTICAWSAEVDWYDSDVVTARTVRTWTTLEDSLGCEGFSLKTGGDRNWIGSASEKLVHGVALEVGETSWLTAEFEGAGVVTDEIRNLSDASAEWKSEERWFETGGPHTIRWEGGEIALRNLVFTPASWISFEANGGEGVVPEPLCSAAGYSIVLPAHGVLVRPCHDFSGWTDDGGKSVWNPGETYEVTGSVVFAAVWTEKHLPTPSLELAAQYETESTSCKITAEGLPDGSVIRYTLDGSVPTESSVVYVAPFSVTGNVTVTARAFGEDWFASACATAKTVRLPWTLAECANWSNGEMSCGGAAQWTRDLEDTHDGVAALRSGKIGDEQETYLEAVVTGEGTLSFWWKASSETYRSKPMDYGVVMVDGNSRDDLMIFGETDWTFASVDVTGAGEHVVRWIYCKDEEDDPAAVGEDCIWLDEVSWVGNDQLQPTVVGDEGAVLTGDEEIGFVIRPSGTKTVVEVEIPIGLDAAKVTVEVTVAVTSLKSNGAKVKIVSGGADITEFLDLPSADGEGVIDLSRAAVRSEIVNEVLDPEKGAVIELTPDSPILTTVNTRPGLVYTLHEGAALDGMTSGDSKVGDGEPWTPDITVKGGNSAFYFISVGK